MDGVGGSWTRVRGVVGVGGWGLGVGVSWGVGVGVAGGVGMVACVGVGVWVVF